MADTHPLASRCTTQDAEEARARAPFAKLGSTEEAHRVGIALDRLASVAKRPRPCEKPNCDAVWEVFDHHPDRKNRTQSDLSGRGLRVRQDIRVFTQAQPISEIGVARYWTNADA